MSRRGNVKFGKCAHKCRGRGKGIFRKCVRVCMRSGRSAVTVARKYRKRVCYRKVRVRCRKRR